MARQARHYRRSAGAALIPVPMLRLVRDRVCQACGAPALFVRASHPLAKRYPAIVSDARHGRRVGPDCLHCGAPFPPSDAEQEVEAVLTGRSPAMLAARACLAIARALVALMRKLQR